AGRYRIERSGLGSQSPRRYRNDRLTPRRTAWTATAHFRPCRRRKPGKDPMSVRSHPDPAVYLALPVWLCAAIVFPLQIGMAGAPAPSLLFYLIAAGALLSVADALHDTAGYGNWQVALFEWLLRVLGLAVPAFLAYTLGALA